MKRIPVKDLVHGQYYWGFAASDPHPGVARWNECYPDEDPSGCFVCWTKYPPGNTSLMDLSIYEFTPYEVVTWSIDEIPLED